MSKLEALQPNATVRGILPDCLVTVVNVQWFGSAALELTYKTPAGKVANELLYRHDESRIEVVELGRPWSFDGDGAAFRLVSEAHRIRLAHLFDPVLAVHTSMVEPLPHQITAVYDAMLPRQPLRFLLASEAYAKNAIAPAIIERASAAAYNCPSLATVSPRVASATDGAAPNNPAKLFGLRMSPIIANEETTSPPTKNRITICVIASPISQTCPRDLALSALALGTVLRTACGS